MPVEVVPGVVVVVGTLVDVGTVEVVPGFVVVTGTVVVMVTVTGTVVVVVDVIVTVVPVVLVVVVSVDVGFVSAAELDSVEEPAVIWASPTPAAAANTRPATAATATLDRRLTRANLGMVVPFVGDFRLTAQQLPPRAETCAPLGRYVYAAA